jgi:hypothetical protein
LARQRSPDARPSGEGRDALAIRRRRVLRQFRKLTSARPVSTNALPAKKGDAAEPTTGGTRAVPSAAAMTVQSRIVSDPPLPSSAETSAGLTLSVGKAEARCPGSGNWRNYSIYSQLRCWCRLVPVRRLHLWAKR